MRGNHHRLLLRAFDTAVRAALPSHYLHATGLVDRIAALPPACRCHIIGVGKSAAAMAAALEEAWPRPIPPSGIAVTRDGYTQPMRWVTVLQAGHPFPDARSENAAKAVTAYLRPLGAADHVVLLLSGGGSALLSWPVKGVRLEALRDLIAQLMARGVAVDALNIVRKHLTQTLGGKLGRLAHPASIDAVILSDVVGDDPSTIASGPFHPDPTSLADALSVIGDAGVTADPAITAALQDAANETPKPGDPCFARLRTTVIPADCWIAPVTRLLTDEGYAVEVIDRHADADARELATAHAALSRARLSEGRKIAIVSGGEATVRLRGDGVGGPNAEYALQLAVALDGVPDIWAIACDTDGTDGPTDAAGAFIGPHTLGTAHTKSLCPAADLADSNSGGFFAALGDAVVSGPTMTNVNDFRVILIDPEA